MISVPMLDEATRLALFKEAQSYIYTPKTEVVGTGSRIVRQQCSSFDAFPSLSLYFRLKESFQALMAEQLATVVPYPFTTPLEFNKMVLQKYEPGELGITPHRDGLSAINLVAIFNIAGAGQFSLCADRSGKSSRKIDSTPGRVIFLRAPGFINSLERPFHSITNIKTTRYSFGLRQKA
ncbi:hypothetical protein [Scytonema sp. NUACC26]|uniref:hypothetical protein n=1 Tax=Scytonema sp. NUACC26 TaxID=3140176 RepID=UPI0038B25930